MGLYATPPCANQEPNYIRLDLNLKPREQNIVSSLLLFYEANLVAHIFPLCYDLTMSTIPELPSASIQPASDHTPVGDLHSNVTDIGVKAIEDRKLMQDIDASHEHLKPAAEAVPAPTSLTNGPMIKVSEKPTIDTSIKYDLRTHPTDWGFGKFAQRQAEILAKKGAQHAG